MLQTMPRASASYATTSSRVTVDSSNYKAIRQEIFQRNITAAKYAMPEDEYLKIYKKARSARPADPGPRPRLSRIANPTQRKAYQLKWEAWKWDSAEFKANEEFRAAFKQDMLTRLPDSFVKSITDPDLGTMHLSDEDCLKLADKTFGTISPAALAQLKRNLPTAIVRTPDELKDVANQQRGYYAIAKSAGQETGENEKVSNFMNLLDEGLAVYRVLFNKTYKKIEDRKFELAVEEMIEAAEELALTDHSANSALVTNSINAPNSYNEFMANAATAALPAGFTKPKRNNFNKRMKANTNAPGTNKIMDQSSLSYCWSHGPNRSHSSQECTHQHPNHDMTATLTNQKGGRKDIWKAGDVVGP